MLRGGADGQAERVRRGTRHSTRYTTPNSGDATQPALVTTSSDPGDCGCWFAYFEEDAG